MLHILRAAHWQGSMAQSQNPAQDEGSGWAHMSKNREISKAAGKPVLPEEHTSFMGLRA
jgi:uncharacterized protein (DUF952 family)